jgi:hypothetical protein
MNDRASHETGPSCVTTEPSTRSIGRRPALAAAGIVGLGALATSFARPTPAHAEGTGDDSSGEKEGTGVPGWFPQFHYQGEVTEDLDYDPTDEVIFPTVIHAGRHLEHPLGEWYLYYAPHDDPGGICLTYADSLDGPWTEHPDNPLITNEWAGHYKVPHVSSAHVIWNRHEQQMFCYFHGPNSVTRFATSTDGLHFEYGDVAITTEMTGPESTETSYARVFEHPDPRRRGGYGMFFMENTTEDHRRIRVADSPDGRIWQVRPDPLITPEEQDDGNVSGGNLWRYRGRLYVIYHGSSGTIFARRVDPTLSHVGPARELFTASGEGEDVGRAAAPVIIRRHGTTYMFYEQGARLEGTIAYATAKGW